ncbi:MAG: hypothetical protein AMJ53_02085 [Gammaproteobacteria bacterium SG8_11]|nr:MAG: hypothetical protein AMJ53_02085 [Gammaproteobacteria bacterium SG8_11]
MEEFCLDRHFKLWDDNNKLIKRIVFLTAVISLALVVKVLVPFVNDSGKKTEATQRIEALEKNVDIASEKIQIIAKTESVLKEVNKFIDDKPWEREKRDLIKRYERMRVSPPAEGYSLSRYQQEADDSIREIGKMLRTNIADPLQSSIEEWGGRHRDLGWLKTEIEALNGFIKEWESQLLGKKWYSTIAEKDITMRELWEKLRERLDEFSNIVNKELANVTEARTAVSNELQTLSTQINNESQQLQDLEKELQKILPQWISGLLTIEQVIQLLPVMLLSIAIAVIAIGVSLTRHYTIYIHGKQFDKAIANDPAMSSAWTLIPRGRYGTVQTIMAYTLFLIFTWILLERSVVLLLEWLSIDNSKAWVGTYEPWEVFLWASRATFVVLLGYVVSMPWRVKYEKNPKPL